ncbi:MAG: ankyrin repeat domain-containing protein [Alphaproteobacteria bacterium]|nr:ankyrin repeat domain-containing protein [Alphaproteobacteria bacterium]
MTGRLLAFFALMSLAFPATAASTACEGWNKKAFFKAATALDVSNCLAAGADLRARDENGMTPLHWAARFIENPEVVSALVTAGANPNARGKIGHTPLHWAAGFNVNPAVVSTLLDVGADPKA